MFPKSKTGLPLFPDMRTEKLVEACCRRRERKERSARQEIAVEPLFRYRIFPQPILTAEDW
jgi:hypothetical protein